MNQRLEERYLLRNFIREALVMELRRDDHFIDHLKRQSGIGTPRTRLGMAARQIATEWVKDLETELGTHLPLGYVAQINKFVAKRWQGLLQRYRGDHGAAHQTMQNLLNTKYSSLRIGD